MTALPPSAIFQLQQSVSVIRDKQATEQQIYQHVHAEISDIQKQITALTETVKRCSSIWTTLPDQITEVVVHMTNADVYTNTNTSWFDFIHSYPFISGNAKMLFPYNPPMYMVVNEIWHTMRKRSLVLTDVQWFLLHCSTMRGLLISNVALITMAVAIHKLSTQLAIQH